MKKLIITRHAKSSWDLPVADFDRPLMQKGMERAAAHAGLLHESIDFIPEFWASSYAQRALHTAVIFAREFNHVEHLKIQENLYTFSAEALQNAVYEFPDVLESAILFGHNDACLHVINSFCATNLKEFKTASCAVIEFKQNRWENIEKGKLVCLIEKGKVNA